MQSVWNVALSIVATVAIASECSCSPAIAPPANIVVDKSPARVERGRYIYTTFADCDSCHSERDYSRLYGPVDASRRGAGAVVPFEGLPGRIVASNITPDRETGIGAWTDGEKIRAIREGIAKDGRVLYPSMPYQNYRYMSDQDVQSLVAYLDQLPAIRNPLPKTDLPPSIQKSIRGAPRPVEGPVPPPDPSNQASYGEYLATLADCEDCHTPLSRGKPDQSRRFAGGQVFTTPAGSVVAANISPDRDTGIGTWDFARFRDRLRIFKTYGSIEALPKVGPDRFTVMHFIAYSALTDQDLAALFAYLQTRSPVTNSLQPHPGVAPSGK
ncbi:MAG TPA: c-type cytochrome [Bryobacteraceae bacterium]|nr:c-type cytochrome [Bryobacteraceae bacterium]